MSVLAKEAVYRADESDIDDANLDPNIEIEMDESYDESSEVGDDDEIVFDEQKTILGPWERQYGVESYTP